MHGLGIGERLYRANITQRVLAMRYQLCWHSPVQRRHLAQYLILGDSNPNVTIPDKVAAQRQLERIGVGFSPFTTTQYRLAGTMTTSEDYPFTQLFQGRLYFRSGISAENIRWTEISLTLSFVSR